jgi:hypothetical protein
MRASSKIQRWEAAAFRVSKTTERERSDRFQLGIHLPVLEIGRFAPVL